MSRQKPSTEEIIGAIQEAMAGHYSTVPLENIRVRTQRLLKTVGRTARDWMFDGLTDPAQDELVLLHSNDSKYVSRIVRADSGGYSYYGDLAEGGGRLMLRLDRSGARTDSGDDAVRNVVWVMRKSTLDEHVAALLKQEQEEKAAGDKEKAAEDAKVEGIIGTELSLIRGMLAAANITPGDRTLTAWAMQVHKIDEKDGKREGKTVRRARVTLELNTKQLVQLAKWLRDNGIEPVAAPGTENQS